MGTADSMAGSSKGTVSGHKAVEANQNLSKMFVTVPIPLAVDDCLRDMCLRSTSWMAMSS